jgi:predicted Zn-dependent peptidase
MIGHRMVSTASITKLSVRTLTACITLTALCLGNLPAMAQDGLNTKRPAIAGKPVPLDWRKVQWTPINYARTGIAGGGSLYTVVDNESRKFRLSIVFPAGVYALPQQQRPTLGALAEMLVEGGTKKQSYEVLEQFLSENGISLRSAITGDGDIAVVIEGLSTDFELALQTVSDVLKEPGFRDAAFDTWKRNQVAEFESLMDAKSTRDQFRIIEPSLIKSVFGPDHYFATFLERTKPSTINAIKLDEVRGLFKKVITRTGLTAMAAGGLNPKQVEAVRSLLGTLPAGDPGTLAIKWLPARSTIAPRKKVSIVVINKPDMPQSTIAGRVVMSNVGELNPLEIAELVLARDVYSSTSGVVGEDRFSGALRKRSGLSYSAHSNFDANALRPNTNEGTWSMMFQTPADKTADGIELAWNTWQEFITKGITEDEFTTTRTILMNKMLSSENPILEKSAGILAAALRGDVPSATPDEDVLASLEQLRGHNEVNSLIKELSASDRTRAAFALIGGLNDKQIEQLRKLKFVESVEVIAYEALKQGLK